MTYSRILLGIILVFCLVTPSGAQTSPPISVQTSPPPGAQTPGVSAFSTSVQIVDFVQKLVATAAVAVAGWWAFFRFIRFRTLNPRVEFSFDWKTDILDVPQLVQGTSLLGILTVKLANRGNTQIELRKDENYRCTLGVGLITPPSNPGCMTYANCRASALEPLPFLFKAHRRIEPGETIDDVVVIFVKVRDAVAIQFNAQLLTLRPTSWLRALRGKGDREALMSSTVAFPIAPGKSGSSASNNDEQDDYNEIHEARAYLFGWIGEAKALRATNLSDDAASKFQTELDKASRLLPLLVDNAEPEVIKNAFACADELKKLVNLR